MNNDDGDDDDSDEIEQQQLWWWWWLVVFIRHLNLIGFSIIICTYVYVSEKKTKKQNEININKEKKHQQIDDHKPIKLPLVGWWISKNKKKDTQKDIFHIHCIFIHTHSKIIHVFFLSLIDIDILILI